MLVFLYKKGIIFRVKVVFKLCLFYTYQITLIMKFTTTALIAMGAVMATETETQSYPDYENSYKNEYPQKYERGRY